MMLLIALRDNIGIARDWNNLGYVDTYILSIFLLQGKLQCMINSKFVIQKSLSTKAIGLTKFILNKYFVDQIRKKATKHFKQSVCYILT